MRKCFFAILIFVFCINAGFAQGIANPGAANTGVAASSPVPQMDDAVKGLAADINRKLVEKKAASIVVGQFTFQDGVPSFSAYWNNQLTGEVSNISNRPYTVFSGGQSNAEWTITGEIVEAADIVRVYSRLLRTADRAIEASFFTSFQRNEFISEMLVVNNSGGRSSSTARDSREPDSWDNPVPYEIGVDESAAAMSRSLHSGEDEDFFLLVPARDGRLVMETTGSTDTMMEFYDADSRDSLESNDDGGSSYNARIRYNVQAGRRYIAKVTGYSGATGAYSFRAYLPVQAQIAPDEFEPDNESSAAKTIEPGTSQRRTFHNGNDVDWVKFEAASSGRYIIRTRGVNSNRLDTYIELFNSNLVSIAEDDDGGDSLSSRISRQLEAGLYYLKIWCLDDDPDQPYTLSIERE